ncbi:hypothetical protein GOBAR_AA08314 [Gossypium barbadense]|uniref:NADH dehydrogenase [ubiquinone] 1 alpha subcomplex subunit 6 n=1 Tax=Gossypium barbadense TaxID=3634 RepID=A0A2P5Y9S6_GOSBA|nr:hypothetical protein GOBAR_AA08314 [Gossypium barbadense]
MAFTLRSVKVPPNSASLEEARSRVFDFFRQACRSIPTIMDIYNLDDVVTKSELRSSISSEIRKNSHVTNPKPKAIKPFFKSAKEGGDFTHKHREQKHTRDREKLQTCTQGFYEQLRVTDKRKSSD